MSTYTRTAIRRIAVRGFRSLKDVVVEDIPDIVVLHGPNGGGKSNLLRAAQLVLRAVPIGGALPVDKEGAVRWGLADANTALGLRPEDFHFGSLPEIHVELAIALGARALDGLVDGEPGERAISLEIHATFQYDGKAGIQHWFEKMRVSPDDSLDERIQVLRRAILPAREPRAGSKDVFRGERLRRVTIPSLLQTSEAYRVPGGADDPQVALYNAFLSEDPRERDAVRRLGRRLATAGLFGAAKDDVGLIPVDSRTYGEKQIRFRHPTHGELPLRNLGSGEQQLVIMLGQRVITPFPIAQIEEPEAHLHRTLMEPLARLLLQSVQGDGGIPDVDQLWIATHHHHFAIAPEFFDVSLDEDGNTQVVRKLRDLAVTHFYEPSPYWDTLRTLLESGMSPDTVVSLDAEGNPVRAGEVLASIQGDRRLANEFVAAATRAFVLSLAKDEPLS